MAKAKRIYAVWMLTDAEPPNWERHAAFGSLELAQEAVRTMLLTHTEPRYAQGHVEKYGQILWRAVHSEYRHWIEERENADQWEVVWPW